MAAGKYLKVTGLYIIGVIVIICGLYIFFTESSPDMICNSFYVMFGGLVVSGIGSVYGRKKLRNPDFRKALKEEKKQKKLKEREREKERLRKAKEKEIKKQAKVTPEPATAAAPAESAAVEAPVGGVIKVIICPHCGEENRYTARFCDKCGKRLRPK